MAGTNGHTAAPDLFGEFKALPVSDDQRLFVEKVNELQEAITRTMGIAREVFEMGSRVVLKMSDTPEKEKKPHAIKACLTHFDLAHQKKFGGEKATIHGGQDAATMKRLIDQHGEPRVVELIDEFFAIDDGDDWLRRTGWTVPNFAKRIPGMIASARTPLRALGNTPRTAPNGQYAKQGASMIKRAYGTRGEGPF